VNHAQYVETKDCQQQIDQCLVIARILMQEDRQWWNEDGKNDEKKIGHSAGIARVSFGVLV
jgi:hypothetical protein